MAAFTSETKKTGQVLEEKTWRKWGEEEAKARDNLGIQRERALATAKEQSSGEFWKPSRPCE